MKKIIFFIIFLFIALTLSAQSMRITYPSANDVLKVGEVINIQWQAPAIRGYISLTLFRGNEKMEVLTRRVDASKGRIMWRVKDYSNRPGSDRSDWYVIRMETERGGFSTYSQRFYIGDRNYNHGNKPDYFNRNYGINIIYPNGGERFNPGERVTVRWNGGTPGAKIAVFLIDQSRGENVHLIASNLVNDGTYAFTIPYRYGSGNFRIAVAEMSISDRVFQVSGITNKKGLLRFTSKFTDDTWMRGKKQKFTWDNQYIDDDLRIWVVGYPQYNECEYNYQQTENNMIRWPLGYVSANQRMYEPELPEGLPPGKYKIVMETSDGNFRTESESYFHVRPQNMHDLSVSLQKIDSFDGRSHSRRGRDMGFDIVVTNNSSSSVSDILVEYYIRSYPLGQTVKVESMKIRSITPGQVFRYHVELDDRDRGKINLLDFLTDTKNPLTGSLRQGRYYFEVTVDPMNITNEYPGYRCNNTARAEFQVR
ncbi:MAG: hypothetical protein JW737_02345 [Acidobacteria bacterium]|nr:hypothetical protein [Acidobacteriota bacterium]